MTLFRSFIILAAGLLLPATAAQADVAESGWRAATQEEKDMRAAFENAQGSWRKSRDGEPEMYECMMRWASWGSIVRGRDLGDTVPTIAGDLTHSYADGQLTHYFTVLVRQAGNIDTFSNKLTSAARLYSNRPNEDLKTLLQKLGKCYVTPTSWQIDPTVTLTSIEFMDIAFNEKYPDVLPEFVRSSQNRRTYDGMILKKDFVGAANFGASLHGRNDKTTVMWNEVLAASKYAVASGRGTELSDALLTTLSKVWWPKSNRSVAEGLLMKKHGRTVEKKEGPKAPDIPYWAQQEHDRFLRGETNYTPCNQWYNSHC